MATTEPAITRLAAHYSMGGNDPVDVLVLHDEEYKLDKDSAEAIAQYFSTPGAGGSAHYVVDQNSIQHCVDEKNRAWHAPPNPHTLGWERDGFASWSLKDWLQPMAQLTSCITAASMAIRALQHNIPIVFVNASQQRAGMRGITTHRERSWAFGQSDHMDPGPFFPIATFIAMVAHARAMLNDIKACQQIIGATVDGDAGVETMLKLGFWLFGNSGVVPLPPPAPKPTQHKLGDLPLVVDGLPGRETWAAWQRAVGAVADGYPGPDTWKHIQRRVGVTADGDPGPITWKAVQRHVSAVPDGVPGFNTWRAIQTALNARRF